MLDGPILRCECLRIFFSFHYGLGAIFDDDIQRPPARRCILLAIYAVPIILLKYNTREMAFRQRQGYTARVPQSHSLLEWPPLATPPCQNGATITHAAGMSTNYLRSQCTRAYIPDALI